MKELALHILDIIENSITANAKNVITYINEDETSDLYEIKIVDNGKGMNDETLRKVQDPFFTTRTTRKVGMGISLFKQAAMRCGGSLSIKSKPGTGTEVITKMQLHHIDRQPLGDIAGVFVQLFCSYPNVDFKYIHTTHKGQYNFDSEEIKKTLGDIKHINVEIRKFIKEMIQENLDEIMISK
jgi:anti-sigma regulatory factor (Ser/Thr protein kinase)